MTAGTEHVPGTTSIAATVQDTAAAPAAPAASAAETASTHTAHTAAATSAVPAAPANNNASTPAAATQTQPPSPQATRTVRRVRPSAPRRNRASQAGWTDEEDAILTRVVAEQNGKNWKKIASFLKNRKPEQCLHRWQKVLNPTLTKGLWTPEEDEALKALVKQYQPKRWSLIASHLKGRNGKQCRERWHNHLDPTIKKHPFTKEEDRILLEAHASVGNKWALISSLLPGRTHNAVKNRWHSALKRFSNVMQHNSGALRAAAIAAGTAFPQSSPVTSVVGTPVYSNPMLTHTKRKRAGDGSHAGPADLAKRMASAAYYVPQTAQGVPMYSYPQGAYMAAAPAAYQQVNQLQMQQMQQMQFLQQMQQMQQMHIQRAQHQQQHHQQQHHQHHLQQQPPQQQLRAPQPQMPVQQAQIAAYSMAPAYAQPQSMRPQAWQ